MNARSRFLAAANCLPTDRPPVWLMRQAGRYLPEYRALKTKHDFVTMVRTPELATEVTLQPLQRFALDAAIIFSDILVIPEALGQPYYFREQGGIGMEAPLDRIEKIKALQKDGAADRLAYVYDALRLTRAQLGEDTALLGFCGSPWTLACYMVEGGSSKDFAKIKTLAWTEPKVFADLMETLTDTCAEYLRRQVDAGADAVQIFDSWGAICPAHLYETWSLRWIRGIIDRLGSDVPVILYAKGMCHLIPQLSATGASILSMDWTIDLAEAAALAPAHLSLQGNLDPAVLTSSPETTRAETHRVLESMAGRAGYIFNLGHGMIPSAKIECVEALVDTVVHSSPRA